MLKLQLRIFTLLSVNVIVSYQSKEECDVLFVGDLSDLDDGQWAKEKEARICEHDRRFISYYDVQNKKLFEGKAYYKIKNESKTGNLCRPKGFNSNYRQVTTGFCSRIYPSVSRIENNLLCCGGAYNYERAFKGTSWATFYGEISNNQSRAFTIEYSGNSKPVLMPNCELVPLDQKFTESRSEVTMINFEFGFTSKQLESKVYDKNEQADVSSSFGLKFFNPMLYFITNPLLAHQTVNIIRAGNNIYLVNTKNKVIKFQENELRLNERPAALNESRIINAKITELENDMYRPVKKITNFFFFLSSK